MVTFCYRLQIAGDGFATAQAVAYSAAARNALGPFVEVPSIGDIPTDFDGNVPAYNHGQIIQMVMFYNDNLA